MPGPRQLVPPPNFVDRNFGLLSVVQPRYDASEASGLAGSPENPYWRNGVTFSDICGLAGTTWDWFCVTGVGSRDTKAENVDNVNFGATPFTVFGRVDCSPVGYSQDEERARAVSALTRNESWQVERAFATGVVGGAVNAPATVYPHLQATEAVTDTAGIRLQCAATSVTGSTILDVVEGFGRLEAAMANCWNGQFVIHVPVILGEALFDHHLVDTYGAQIKTRAGNLVALGAGYTGLSPAGAATANAAWIYATPPIFAYRSGPETFTFREELDRDTNTLQTIVERTYVLGFPCCCFYALPVSVGGDVTGQPVSAF